MASRESASDGHDWCVIFFYQPTHIPQTPVALTKRFVLKNWRVHSLHHQAAPVATALWYELFSSSGARLGLLESVTNTS
jgi:hypothetical protein